MTLLELKEILGHSSLAMVQRYAHLAPEHRRSAVAAIDDILPALEAEAVGHGTSTAHEPATRLARKVQRAAIAG